MINFTTYEYQSPKNFYQKVRNFMEGYFHIKDYVALDLDSGIEFQCKVSSWGVTALKIASYITCIIPLIVGIALLIYRGTDSIIPHLEENPFRDMDIESMVSVAKKTAKAVFVIGGMGCGKSSLTEDMLKRGFYKGYKVLDADQEKENIPEYKAAVERKEKDAGTKFQSQSLTLRNQKYASYVKDRLNFIYLGTGADLDFYRKNIQELKEKKYYIRIILVQADQQVLQDRCKKRGNETGRFVPAELVVNSYRKASENFEQYKLLVNDWQLYDNTLSLKLLCRKKRS